MKNRVKTFVALFLCGLTWCFWMPLITVAQVAPAKPPATMVAGIPVNYDEAKVGTYTLPDVLTMQNGKKVTDKQTWLNKRRPEIVSLFEENQFGKMPGKPADLSCNVFDKGTSVFNGTAIRKQITVYFTKDTGDHKMDILLYMPAKAAKPMPLLLMISFSPNSSMSPEDPGVKGNLMWNKEGKKVASPKTGLGKLDVQKFTSAGIA